MTDDTTEVSPFDPIKVTLKGGTGYDAPWITVAGPDPLVVAKRLQGLLDSGLVELTVNVAQQFGATNLAARSLGGRDVHQETPTEQKQAQEAAPEAGAHYCPHGKRNQVGTRERPKQGKFGDYIGYFCPLGKDDPNSCKPEFVDVK